MPANNAHDNNITDARRSDLRRASLFVGNMQHLVTAKFGKALKRKRVEKQLTQIKLADISELNRSYISQVERGQVSISLERAEKLAQCVGSSLVDLLAE